MLAVLMTMSLKIASMVVMIVRTGLKTLPIALCPSGNLQIQDSETYLPWSHEGLTRAPRQTERLPHKTTIVSRKCTEKSMASCKID